MALVALLATTTAIPAATSSLHWLQVHEVDDLRPTAAAGKDDGAVASAGSRARGVGIDRGRAAGEFQ